MNLEALVKTLEKRMQVAASIRAAVDHARAQSDHKTAHELLRVLQAFI